MIYIKDTYKPEHVGRKVKWNSFLGFKAGTGTLKGFDGGIVKVWSDDPNERCTDDSLWYVDNYELIDEFPMPLKEAYDRGLLKVGQKIRTTINHGNFDTTEKIISILDDSITLDHNGELTYSYGWIVESIEEPKEEEKQGEHFECDDDCQGCLCGVLGHIAPCSHCVEHFRSGETLKKVHNLMKSPIASVNEDWKMFIIDPLIKQLTKPTLMSKLTTIWSNLTLSADEKLLRELNLHDSEGKPTGEYIALQEAIIAEEYEGKVLEAAKKIKAELDAEKE
jgi:hypothetical protein